MQRDLASLTRQRFDLVVVGGGITGAFVAWDAALRGLEVALVERHDFGHATSAASSKVIHGGIRHLQQGALGRVRESLRERTAFRIIAPHLVHPLPFLIPTHGHGLRGKEILSLGMLVYELLGFDQNRVVDPQKRIPPFQLLSRQAALALEPGLPATGMTGAVRYTECHLHSSERMTLAVVRAAAAAGAVVANYVEAVGLERQGGAVAALTARDLIHDAEPFRIQARTVANVSGPWARRVLDGALGASATRVAFSKGVHLVTRPLTRSGALALATRHANESLINRGGRHFFIIPWRGHALVGTTNVPHAGGPGDAAVTESDLLDFIDEINAAYPAAALERTDVRHAFAGLYPLVNKDLVPGRYQGAGQYQILDHGQADGVDGLVTVIGAKFTTARNLARQAVDLIVARQGARAATAPTATTRVPGGVIERFDDFLAGVVAAAPQELDPEVLDDLVRCYGSELDQVLALVAGDPRLGARLAPDRAVIAATVVHAARAEMALHLGDVVFRRTGLGTIGHPGSTALEHAAALMGAELEWSAARRQSEVEDVEARFVNAHAAAPRAGSTA